MRASRVLHFMALGVMLAVGVEAATVDGTIRRNPDLKAGADADGRVLLYTPKPVQPGSTHSHFDNSALPNLLMEPGISSDLKSFRVDLTKHAMQDLGWQLGALNVKVNYSDSSGTGFKDPVLGDDRKVAFEAAAETWGVILGSSINVNVEARFRDLRCSEEGGTLASAGPRFVFIDFPGGTPGTWYPGPLAESVAGDNLSTADDPNAGAADIVVTFNSGIDEECLGAGSGFYYGLDSNAPAGRISFSTVALHELGHGLGFVGLVDSDTGDLFRRAPDIFTTLTYDTKKKKHWDEMTTTQRKKSAKRSRKVSFDGENTTRRAARVLKGKIVVEISEPEKLAGAYDVGTASFGPTPNKTGVSGELALVDDGSATPTFACQPILNGDDIAGKIAVIDRGDCFFVDKVKNAQNVGAVGVIIVHNESGPPPGLGGSDDSIVIPSVRVGKKDGKKIKRHLRRE